MIRACLYPVILFFALIVTAALAAEETLLLRSPTASADHIAFAYAGDLWVAGRDGGEARRLTVHAGMEGAPAFSPDGRLIAFSGDYDGNVDVYVTPVEGGSPRRLTYHPGFEVVEGWTPDGRAVLFNSARISPSRRGGRLFTVPAAGGFPEPLPMPMAERGGFSPDGKRIAYTPIRDAFQTWKRYRGGTTPPVWIFDLKTHEVEEVPHENASDTNPFWVGEEVFFLSDRNGVMNLFAYHTGTKELRQVTHHDDFDVKRASAGGGVIVFEQAGRIHELDPKTGVIRLHAIRINADLPHARPRFADASKAVRSAAISPTGKRAAFGARGEIFTVPAKKGDVRNITNTPDVHERYPAWSPDGRWIAYLSDEGGEYHLMIREQDGLSAPRKVSLGDPTFYYQPHWSPDGKKLAYADKRLNLWYLEVGEEEAGEPVKVDTDTYSHPERTLEPVWSPDSRWIAYAKRLDNFLHAVFLYDLEKGERHRVTDGMSDAVSPTFSRDGKYLHFAASTNVGLGTGWLDMTSIERPLRRSLYLAVLGKEEPSPFAPESDEEEVKEDKEGEEEASETKAGEEEKKKEPGNGGAEEEAEGEGQRGDEKGEKEEREKVKDDGKEDEDRPGDRKNEKKDDKKDKGVEVRIDFEGLDQRIIALPVPEGDFMELRAADGGQLFYLEVKPGRRGETVLHRFDMKERKAEAFLEGVAAYTVSHDGKQLLYMNRSQTWGITAAAGKPGPGAGILDLGGLQAWVDPRAEWEQMYEEAWRIERDFFYDPFMHGADWEGVREKYRPFLGHVGHRSDLNGLFADMLGELVVGHAYVGGGDMPERKSVSVGLLGADYAVEDGFYRIKKIYNGENWNPDLRAPLTEPGVNVSEGDFLLAVNGRALKAPANLFSLFLNTADRQTVIEVNDRPDREGARKVTVVPVGGESGLRHRDWVEGNRRKVDALTGGRVAYVYMPDTAGGGYAYFNRYYFAQQDREAVIIDERNNGGGLVADYIIDLLRRPILNYNATRDGKIQTSPIATIPGPKVMIINEYAGSGGDAMPYYFRLAKVGPLVGKRTWGGLVGIYDYPILMDGGRVTAPRIAFFGTHGNWIVENEGVPPDIEVEQTPKLVIQGGDPQLEKAVEVVLDALEKNPVPKPVIPPYPKRAQR